VLLQTPGPRVEKVEDRDVYWQFALTTSGPPFGFELIASWENGCPTITDEVRDKDDESALDRDIGRFELCKQGVSQMYKCAKILVVLPHRSGT
jgi:hypothetical protein